MQSPARALSCMCYTACVRLNDWQRRPTKRFKLDVQVLMSTGVILLLIPIRPANSPWPVFRPVVQPVISSDLACGSRVRTSVTRPPRRAVREHLEPQQESSERLTSRSPGRARHYQKETTKCAEDI